MVPPQPGFPRRLFLEPVGFQWRTPFGSRSPRARPNSRVGARSVSSIIFSGITGSGHAIDDFAVQFDLLTTEAATKVGIQVKTPSPAAALISPDGSRGFAVPPEG